MNRLSLPERIATVRERIVAASARAGRSAEEVTIVAVTKTHPPEAVQAVLAAGIADIGENRLQELEAKIAVVGRDAARWHLIGHLQRNKSRRAVALADVIHSVDSVRLAETLSRAAAESISRVEVLVQVNVSGEASKGGLEPEVAVDEIGAICEMPGIRVRGLMTMAPFTDDERVIRSVFRGARLLLEEVGRAVPAFEPAHLSMGMSNDFEVAVEEGSTLLRLGTVLLGDREVGWK